MTQELISQLQTSIKQAMINKDKRRLGVLRDGLMNAVNTYKKDNRVNIIDNQTFYDIVKSEVKTNTDFIKKVEKQKDNPTVAVQITDRETNIAILQEFLPKQLMGEELYREVSKILYDEPLDIFNPKKAIGVAINVAKNKLGNQASNADISDAVKKWLGL